MGERTIFRMKLTSMMTAVRDIVVVWWNLYSGELDLG